MNDIENAIQNVEDQYAVIILNPFKYEPSKEVLNVCAELKKRNILFTVVDDEYASDFMEDAQVVITPLFSQSKIIIKPDEFLNKLLHGEKFVENIDTDVLQILASLKYTYCSLLSEHTSILVHGSETIEYNREMSFSEAWNPDEQEFCYDTDTDSKKLYAKQMNALNSVIKKQKEAIELYNKFLGI